MDKRNALKIARNYVKFLIAHRHYKIRAAFLFGSYTRNNFNSDSDIDIALILEGYDDTIEELSKLMQFRRGFDLKIEPHPVAKDDFENNSPFAKEVKKGLKIL
jgi:predicted nucleotidyltransferase